MLTDKQIKPGSQQHIRRLTAARLQQGRDATRSRLRALAAGQRTLPFRTAADDS